MKELIVHCGLHKTGTTALQNFLLANRDTLAANGVLYPKAGVPPGVLSGQHNLAWEMARDRRFRTDSGTLEALFAEMAGFSGKVVLSSEEFETSILHPDRWGRLVGAAQALGFSVHLVVYLREISAHLRSVYLQKLRSGYGQEFSLAARLALEHGSLRWQDGQICFSRPAMEKSLAAIEGAQVTFRSYEAMAGGSTVTDFCEWLGLGGVAWNTAEAERSNPSDPAPLSLLRFLQVRAPEAPELAKAFRDFVFAAFVDEDARLVVPERLRKVLAARLTPGQPEPPATTGGKLRLVNMARLFSFETQVTLKEAFSLSVRQGAGPQARERQKTMIAQWRDWIGVLD